MYVTRIRLANYGPIEQLDIKLPIVDDMGPKPVVLVGENGSGKSVLLSHIVNALMSAQQSAYRETPEVELGKVFKLRSPMYITPGKTFSFARVDFADGLRCCELQLDRNKEDYDTPPEGVTGTDVEVVWNRLTGTDASQISNEGFDNRSRIEQLFGSNCILYFPPDRFEDPAWLNEDKLNARAEHVERTPIQGYTDRKILSYSPLRNNQNWLFDLAYDFSVFERQYVTLPVVLNNETGVTNNIQALVDVPGNAKLLYDTALSIIREVIVQRDNLRLGIARRHSRMVSLMNGDQTLVPNIFQLSSGEVSLLNLFLSILRDYDLTGNQFTAAEDISGIVVVDEIDLHLHARHQYKVLPKLMKMFPKVQFIVTTHSPLFVLGLQEVFGESGFGLYRLPEGRPISPEEFSEFGVAYQAFAETRRHSDEMRVAVREAQIPLVFVDGITDVRYHKKAAELLGFESMLTEVVFRDGSGMLKQIWTGLSKNHVNHEKVIILHDPEERVESDTRANVYRRRIEKIENHPVKTGVENLFSRGTLERAIEHHPAFIDITESHQKTERGTTVEVLETWIVNKDEKTNLCNWLCDNGTAEDFEHFRPTLEMLQGFLAAMSIEDVRD